MTKRVPKISKKMTKKQYEERKTFLENELQKLNVLEKGLNDHLQSKDKILTSEKLDIFEKFNTLYDEQYRIQSELQSLERQWNTRNWTYQDHMQHDLIAQNID